MIRITRGNDVWLKATFSRYGQNYNFDRVDRIVIKSGRGKSKTLSYGEFKKIGTELYIPILGDMLADVYSIEVMGGEGVIFYDKYGQAIKDDVITSSRRCLFPQVFILTNCTGGGARRYSIEGSDYGLVMDVEVFTTPSPNEIEVRLIDNERKICIGDFLMLLKANLLNKDVTYTVVDPNAVPYDQRKTYATFKGETRVTGKGVHELEQIPIVFEDENAERAVLDAYGLEGKKYITYAEFQRVNFFFKESKKNVRFFPELSWMRTILYLNLEGFENLVTLRIPPVDQVIHRGAFKGCKSLNHVSVIGGEIFFESYAFENSAVRNVSLLHKFFVPNDFTQGSDIRNITVAKEFMKAYSLSPGWRTYKYDFAPEDLSDYSYAY